MGRIKKLFLVIVLSIPMCFIPVNCAKATAVGDVALLAQQIAQFLNDWDFDTAKWKDYAEKFKQLEKIAAKISEGSQAYSTLKSLAKTVKYIDIFYTDAQSYINYIQKFSLKDERINSAVYLTRRLLNRSARLYEEFSNIIENLISYSKKGSGNASTSISPIELTKSVEEAFDEFEGEMVEESQEVKNALSDMCIKTSKEVVCEENRQFVSMKWY